MTVCVWYLQYGTGRLCLSMGIVV
uniref:Uncharacterized protein n=1 Tax=Anguilla anguilla TaxID=7936 RepID=A0A0E9QKK1_ANGAN